MDKLEKVFKKQDYLMKFEKYVYPEEFKDVLGSEVKEMGDKIIDFFKEKELTYVDAYATLEYVYRNLKVMSEFTHL